MLAPHPNPQRAAVFPLCRAKCNDHARQMLHRGHYVIGSGNSLENIRRAVLNGLGIAYLPAWMVTKELQSSELVALLTVHAAPPVPVNILYSAEQRLSQRASVFMAFIAQVLADIPGLNSSKTPP